MKYIVLKPKIASPINVYSLQSGGLLAVAGGVPAGAIFIGEEKNIKYHFKNLAPKAGTFIEIRKKPNHFIAREAVAVYSEDKTTSSFSGSDVTPMVSKITTKGVLVPAGVYGGVGLLLGILTGQNKVGLMLGGAVIGGLIGISSSDVDGNKLGFSGADKRRVKITREQWDAMSPSERKHGCAGCTFHECLNGMPCGSSGK